MQKVSNRAVDIIEKAAPSAEETKSEPSS
jgi:hypothetical protein